MSLLTDKIFVKALRANTSLMAMLPAGDVYNTAIPVPDENVDNTQLPYIIVTFDSMTNNDSTKDSYEGDTDTVQVGIEVAASSRSSLSEIIEDIRSTVMSYFEAATEADDDYELVPLDYLITAGPVQYDSMKPCYWQTLHYQCDVNA